MGLTPQLRPPRRPDHPGNPLEADSSERWPRRTCPQAAAAASRQVDAAEAAAGWGKAGGHLLGRSVGYLISLSLGHHLVLENASEPTRLPRQKLQFWGNASAI